MSKFSSNLKNAVHVLEGRTRGLILLDLKLFLYIYGENLLRKAEQKELFPKKSRRYNNFTTKHCHSNVPS